MCLFALRGAPRTDGDHFSGLSPSGCTFLGLLARHRDLCRKFGPGVSSRHEGRTAAAGLAAPPAASAGRTAVQFHMRNRWTGWHSPAGAPTRLDFDTQGRHRSMPMPWYLRWAVAVGHGLGLTGRGCHGCVPLVLRFRHCCLPTVVLTVWVAGPITLPTDLPACHSSPWPLP